MAAVITYQIGQYWSIMCDVMTSIFLVIAYLWNDSPLNFLTCLMSFSSKFWLLDA